MFVRLLFLQFKPIYLLRFFCLLAFLVFVAELPAQTATDTLREADTGSAVQPVTELPAAAVPPGAVSKKPLTSFTNPVWDTATGIPLQFAVLRHHPFFSFNTPAVHSRSDIKKFRGKEMLFYVVVILVIIFALLKLGFSKYFNDLFRVFFRTTLKQRQIKEQLMQTPLPSLVFNGFFVACAGLYITFMLHYFQITPVHNFWLLYLYCCIGLSVIYFVKFIGLIICGWLFNMRKAADSYIFIVFIINKVIGISLLPFVALIAFTDGAVYEIALVLSWCCVGGLFLYRFILGFAAIRNEVRFNLFHFFLYLCAFEIAPLLLIYKLLLFVF